MDAVLVIALLNFAVGLAFAWLGRERVRADGPTAAPAFPLVAMHAGLVVAPLSLYLYAAHGDWAWMYLFDPAKVPSLALVPVTAVHVGLLCAGWFTGAWLHRSERPQRLLPTMAVTAAAAALAVALGFSRLTTAATYEGYRLGASVGLFEVELGYVLGVVLLISSVSVAYVAVELSRDARRARTR
jgi:hypothetical protein